MSPTEQMQRVGELQLAPKVLDVTRIQSQGALSASDPNQLTAAYLQLDPHDLYVTSRSVLGYTDGLRFLDVVSKSGPTLVDPPVAIEG